MALEKIVINVSGQADLDSTIKKLVELGLVDEKNAKQFEKNNKDQQGLINQLNNKIKDITEARNRSNNTADIEKYNKQLAESKNRLDQLTGASNKNSQSFLSLNNVLGKVGGALAGAFAFTKIVELGGRILDITSKFQKFEAVLTNTLGSKSAAQESMQMILEFAAKTPFAVDEITQSYIKLVNQGFRPTQAELTKLGDLASSQGKSLDQLTEAVIDAQTGEFERLKEFGIRAKKEGDKVTFTFKEQNTTVKATAGSIREYILGLGNAQGVSGSMAAISKTLEGQISNLGDSFDQLLLSIGKSGSGGFADVIGVLNSGLGELNKAMNDQPSVLDSMKQAYIGLFRPVKDLWDSIVGLVSNFGEFKNSGGAATFIMEGFAFATKATLIPIKTLIIGVVTLIDSFSTLTKAGKNVYNFFAGKPLENLGIDKLKKDFQNFVDVITFSDGKFEYATGNIVKNTGEVIKAQEEEVRSIKTLEEELKNLVKQRDETAISDRKAINILNEQIKKKQELIKEIKGEGEALKAYNKMREKDNAKSLDIELKTEEEKTKEKIKLKEFEVQEFGNSEKEHTDKLLQEIENRKQAQQIYTDFVINSIGTISSAIAENNRIRTENEINKIDAETDAQLKALQARNEAGLLSDEAFALQKEAIQKKQAQKELELRRRQAQQEKDFALFQIAINTASAVLKAFAQFGPPPSPVGIAAAGAAVLTGGIEAAIVQSRPLPQFKKGGYTGEGNVNDTAGVVHKKEFVMPAEKTAQYREELQQMYEGRYKKNYRDPIKLRQTLTDARNDNMADSIYKSMMLNGQFDDKGIISAISKNANIKLKNAPELANMIANKISDRNGERGLFA